MGSTSVELWDEGAFEAWHGAPGFAPASTAGGENGSLARLLWSAQSRVLMPWIEVRRVKVEQILRTKLTPDRMGAAVDQYATRFPGVEFDPTLVELATLARIITARLGRTEERLRSTTNVLLHARNRLAHLKPLTDDDLQELVQTCAWLG